MAERLSYRIIIERRVEKEAEKIPQKHRSAIDRAILSLSSNPRPYGSEKLTDKEGYRLRTGNYRILYTVDDDARIVVIYRIKAKSESTYK